MSAPILVVQHGEKERVAGDPGLTAVGLHQAEVTAEWLRGAQRVTRLVSSPLRRALETAAPIARRLGLELNTDDRFRERMNWTPETGQSLEDFLADWRRATTNRLFVPHSGDSSTRAADRFIAALGDVDTHGDPVVVVSHGGVTVDAMRTLIGDERVLDRSPTLISDGVPCCAVTTFVHDGGCWTIEGPAVDHLIHPTEHHP